MIKAVLVGGPKDGVNIMLTHCPERIKVPDHNLKLALEFAAIVGDTEAEIHSVVYERDPVVHGWGGPIRYFWVPKAGEQHG